MNNYRIVFAGTPEFAACALDGLLKSGYQIVAVYTQPDRPAGRGQKLQASPVKQLAISHGLDVEQVKDFKSPESLTRLSSYNADLLIVAAYGIILPQEVLDIPKIACLNIHASLLPRWRGAAPIQRAILANDRETGISIMEMQKGLDTGDVLLSRKIPITNTDTGSSLHDKLAELGKTALLETLDHFDVLYAQRCPQHHEQATYASKLNKQEAQINWQAKAEEITRSVRALNNWPVAFTSMEGENIRIWQASAVTEPHSHNAGEVCGHQWQGSPCLKVACADGFILIERLQLPGKKPLATADVLNAKTDLFNIGKCFE